MNALFNQWSASWRAAWRPGVLRKQVNLVFRGITGFFARAIAGFGLVYIIQMSLEQAGRATFMTKQMLWSLYALFIIVAYVPRVWRGLHRTPQAYTHYLYYLFGYWALLLVGGGLVMGPIVGLYVLFYGTAAVGKSLFFKLVSTPMIMILNGLASMMVCAWIDRHKGVEDAIRKGFNVFVAQTPYLFTMLLPFMPVAALLYWFGITYDAQSPTSILAKVYPLLNAFWQLSSWMVWVLVYQSRKGKVEPLKKRRTMRKRPMRRVKKS